MIYVTGDRHGSLTSIKNFVTTYDTTTDDILIILGDAGFNYNVARDTNEKIYVPDGNELIYEILAQLPITIAVVQGNHEAPAWECKNMIEVTFQQGRALQSQAAPNVYFLKNGEIYTFNDKKYLVMGGAYSIDRIPAHRQVPYVGYLDCGGRWFPEEQMSEQEFDLAFDNLKQNDDTVHGVLTHTCPMSERPLEMLIPGAERYANNRMEEKFEDMKDKFNYDIWLFGHYHTDRKIDDKFKILFNDIIELP